MTDISAQAGAVQAAQETGQYDMFLGEEFDKRFDKKYKSLRLPERVTLERDQYFEKDELAIKMKFYSVDELRNHLNNLSNSVNSVNLNNIWNDLFAILREE